MRTQFCTCYDCLAAKFLHHNCLCNRIKMCICNIWIISSWTLCGIGTLLPLHWIMDHYDIIKNTFRLAMPRYPWWCYQMETFSALLAICVGNSPVTGEFPAQRPVTQCFDDFFFICAWINGWVNNREAGDLRRYGTHYDVIIMHR